jgi:protein arginine N-methyltransferase 2
LFVVCLNVKDLLNFADGFTTLLMVLDNPDAVDHLTELGEQLVDSILSHAPTDNIYALIEDGAPLWYQNAEGTSALHAATYVQDEELASFFIENGAVWNAGVLLVLST